MRTQSKQSLVICKAVLKSSRPPWLPTYIQNMETLLMLLTLLHTLGNIALVTAQQCALLNQRQCISLLHGSDHSLTWMLTSSWDPGLARFYRVPDGGHYNSSHMITADNHFIIRDNDLKLVNISAIHEGRYYCVYNGTPLNSFTRDCITVQGRASLSCDIPSASSHSSCDNLSGCTETIEVVSGNTLSFNTAISFHGSGACQLHQEVNDIYLWREGDPLLAHKLQDNETHFYNNRFQILKDRVLLPEVNVSDSGLYHLIVPLSNNIDCLTKTFNVSVISDISTSPPITTTEVLNNYTGSTASTTSPSDTGQSLIEDPVSETNTSTTEPSSTVQPRTHTGIALTDPLIVPQAISGAIAAGLVFGILCILLTVIIVCIVCKRNNSKISIPNNSKISIHQDNTDRLSVYGEELLHPYLYSHVDVIV